MKTRKCLALALIAGGLISFPASAAENPSSNIEVVAKPVTVDRIYKSMEGVTGDTPFNIPAEAEQPELLWVTGGRINMLKSTDGVDGTEKFLCHAYMKFEDQYFKTRRNNPLLKTLQPLRLFTFVQGQPEIRLPRGYGIPVLSSEKFEFEHMVINPTPVQEPFGVTSHGTFDFVRDPESGENIKPLFMRIVGMHIPVKKGDAIPHAQCSELGDLAGDVEKNVTVQKDAVVAKSSEHKILKNEAGYDEVYHWMVPPGRHQYKYQLESKFLGNLPYQETTAHFINAHLHPHGEFIEFWDRTTGEMLFKSKATNNAERSGLLKLTDFSSEKGIPIVRDHQYEMIAEYNNTTDHDIDAMAIIFLYLLDKSFDPAKIRNAA